MMKLNKQYLRDIGECTDEHCNWPFSCTVPHRTLATRRIYRPIGFDHIHTIEEAALQCMADMGPDDTVHCTNAGMKSLGAPSDMDHHTSAVCSRD
jgi:hypothetical protein